MVAPSCPFSSRRFCLYKPNDRLNIFRIIGAACQSCGLAAAPFNACRTKSFLCRFLSKKRLYASI
jgi:hypothetical protein